MTNEEDYAKIHDIEGGKSMLNKKGLQIFLSLATISTLAGSIILTHKNYAVKDLEDMCPISKFYYDLGMNQKAYEHQLNHYNKLLASNNLEYNFEYRQEQYIPIDGYTMNEDGKTCYIEDDPIEIKTNNEVMYVAPIGYTLKGDKCIKTSDAIYECEGILVSDNNANDIALIIYDEGQKKLVKM